MTTVSIVAVPTTTGTPSFYAVAGNVYTFGRTAGEALDAIIAQVTQQLTSTLLVIQYHQPDAYFNATQQKHLATLMERWRKARDLGQSLPLPQQSELETLIEAELMASALRTQAMLNNVTL
jgi:hypothetical protein